MPDRLTNIAKNIIIGKKIIYLDEVDSTSDYIKRALDIGEMTEGTVVAASIQTKGKGRAGRVWESPAGGLWFSLLLYPRLPMEKMALLSLVFAVAISQGLGEIIEQKCKIKWPNDIYLDGKKLAGILLETGSLEEDIYLIIGVGINVDVDKDQLGSLSSSAASLSEHSSLDLNINSILAAVLEYMEMYYLDFQQEGFSQILEEFKELCLHLDQRVKIDCINRIVSGINVDIDSRGRLVVDTGLAIEKISTGDVKVL